MKPKLVLSALVLTALVPNVSPANESWAKTYIGRADIGALYFCEPGSNPKPNYAGVCFTDVPFSPIAAHVDDYAFLDVGIWWAAYYPDFGFGNRIAQGSFCGSSELNIQLPISHIVLELRRVEGCTIGIAGTITIEELTDA